MLSAAGVRTSEVQPASDETRLQIRVSGDIGNRLRRMAQQRGVTRSTLMRMWLTERLDIEEKADKA